MNPYLSEPRTRPIAVHDLFAMKARGEKISCLTAYDASFSALLDKAEIDMILVGDSLGMVVQGHSSTVPVTIEDMVYHTRCVIRGRSRAFVIGDLPFMSCNTVEQAMNNAALLMQQGGAQMVKLEGPRFSVIQALVDQGVPVCGHLGLLPQSIHQSGRYTVKGKEPVDAEQILQDALEIEQSGASMLVLECVPASLAAKITGRLKIPVIGIGAGVDCDGQVLVLYDILNIDDGRKPKFVKNFLAETDGVFSAVQAYHQAVKGKTYPSQEHSY